MGKHEMKVKEPSDQEVAVMRAFDAPRELVFDAFTRPELVRRWLTGPPGWTMPICEIDLKPGGTFRYVWQRPDGSQMGMGGTFDEIERPERVVHRERFDQDWTGGETQVTTLFDEQDGRTTVTTRVRYASKEARDGALSTGMTDGMATGYERLDEVLAHETRPEQRPSAELGAP